jgi:integrase
VREAIAKRPLNAANKADAGLCFLTVQGLRLVRTRRSKSNPDKYVTGNTIAQKFAKLIKSLDVTGGRGFYALRHTFETIGGESKDQVAVNAVMGHVDNTMSATYRERISDERLQAVVGVVRAWLWPE